jgi:hypothetical protein
VASLNTCFLVKSVDHIIHVSVSADEGIQTAVSLNADSLCDDIFLSSVLGIVQGARASVATIISSEQWRGIRIRAPCKN